MPGARAALVVAAHEFVDPKFQQLRSPVQDVESLVGVLSEQTIGGFDVTAVVNESSGVVQQQLERFFSDRKPDDLLLLYFSCHGVKDAAGRLYFVTTNTTFDLLRSTGISASFVSEQMEYSRSKRIVVLLDCCYSGAFLKGFRARGDDAVAVEELEGRGRAVITASRATEYAFEADDVTSENAQPSVFTGAIVDGLGTGKADANGDGIVTVDELYDYVYDAVRGKVAGQTPGRWVDVEGELVVARNPKAQEIRAAAAAARPIPDVPIVVESTPEPVASQRLADIRSGTQATSRPAGILAAAGGLAVLLAPNLNYTLVDGSVNRLSSAQWFTLGYFVLFALAGAAAGLLLRATGSRREAFAILTGMLPVMIGDAIIVVHDLANGSGASPREGWFLLLLGLLAIATSGVIAAVKLRPLTALSLPRVGESGDTKRAALLAGALLAGVAAALGTAIALGLTGGALFDVAGPAQDLAVRLLILVAIVCFGWRWVTAGRVSSRLMVLGASAVFVVIVASFFLSEGFIQAHNWMFAVAYVVLTIGATGVPTTSAALVPARTGAAQLGAWTLAMGAVLLPFAKADNKEVALLVLALAASGGLTALIAATATRKA